MNIRGLQARGLTAPFDLALRAGEILGLYGLKGAGRTDVLRALFGLVRCTAGEIRIGGHPVRIRSPRDAIRAGLGWVCRDRKELSLFANLDVGENLSIARFGVKFADVRLSRLGFIDRSAERRAVTDFIGRLGIRTAGARQAITALSGGNQQKVLLARWLATEPALLILDEPTRGIDVGAKAEIQHLVATLSEQGMAVLFISAELEEVLRLSNRIMVLRDRELVTELDNDRDLTADDVMATIAGGDRA
jgi:simple sugar transport system ATP-binding protein